MKRLISLVFASMLMFCTAVISFADTVTMDQRTYMVVYAGETYGAYFDRTSKVGDPDEKGICYVTDNNIVVAIFNYWYKEGEVVRVYGFSDFLLGPTKLTQIIYGVQLDEVLY
jgi:hypothetical protein